jgi:hypothetical protein
LSVRADLIRYAAVIDFRYHAMSLTAVFVALAVGLLLGVTIGDTELLSNARGNLERSLGSDLARAHKENSDLRRQRENQDEFVQTAYPQLVAGRLVGQRMAVIGSAGATRGVIKPLGGAVEPAGGSIVYAAELVEKPRYAELATAIGVASGFAGGVPTAKQAERLGVAVGHRIVRGRNRLQLRRLVFSKLSGELRRTRLFAYARREPGGIESNDGKRLDAFERGVVKGLARDAQRVVGVETTTTDPSGINWYKSLGLSSTDDIEQYAGHYAFVLVLAGAKGDYGYKKTADAVIPPVAP